MSAAATPRPRLSFAAPLPPGRAAEHDLADLVIGERWTAARVRALLEAALPAGFELVDLFDVWLGAPALTAVAQRDEPPGGGARRGSGGCGWRGRDAPGRGSARTRAVESAQNEAFNTICGR